MTVYKLHDDVRAYQSLTLNIDDYLDLLDQHIGESKAMLLGQHNIAISEFWKPIDLGYYQNEGTVDLADINMWRPGIILLNQKAADVVGDLLFSHGELLPCRLHGGQAYLFNCLNLKSYGSADIDYRMHKNIFVEVESITFKETDTIFKHENKVAFEMYCSEEFVNAVKNSNLKGLLFSERLALARP